MCRDYHKIDLSLFRSFLVSLPSWTAPATDPDIAARQLDADLRFALDKFAPMRRRRRRLGCSKCPWLTPECVAAKRNRRLERRFVRSKSDADRTAYRRAYRETNALFTEARAAFVRGQLDEARGDPRQLWRSVKIILHPGEQRQWYDGLVNQ